MSDIIHLLPDSVANQIAAGEVIQRPASVIKELVENSVDAGAKNIQVLVTDAGRTCIQIIDDGKGMSETDARLAFERHATSKIREAADLFSLHTMGFRGEALASIAAVAQVELKTRLEGEELGTKLIISASKVESQSPASCPQGSNFSVKNLFFNIPARRKFLKANSTELSHILAEFERIVLVHQDITFSLYNNNIKLFLLPAISLRQRILSVFGKKLNQQLMDISVSTTLVKINGYVMKSSASVKKGAHQFFFVNGRFMRHPYFHKAVMTAYEHLIPEGNQISYFIYLEVPTENIDVNIHPTKTEIKFENEQAIWQILFAAIKETLGKYSDIPAIDFDTEDIPDIPVFNDQTDQQQPPKVYVNKDFNPFDVPVYNNVLNAPPSDWGDLYGGLKKPDARQTEGGSPLSSSVEQVAMISSPSAITVADSGDYSEPVESDEEQSDVQTKSGEKEGIMEESSDVNLFSGSPSVAVVEKSNLNLQFKGRYILTSVKSGLMLIDQHRAHVRVLFDRFLAQIKNKKGISQRVLFPEIVQFPASEAVMLESIKDDLSAVGFELSDLGGGSFAINSVPSGTEGLNPVDLVKNMLHSAMEKGNDVKEDIQFTLTLALARASAIVYGQVLSNEEMIGLLDSLFACPSPNYTPDGKIILVTIKEINIEKLFK
ncbi:MAG: DNA mismatch repair endonuclease MutL [Bacteroidaceae bacterium]